MLIHFLIRNPALKFFRQPHDIQSILPVRRGPVQKGSHRHVVLVQMAVFSGQDMQQPSLIMRRAAAASTGWRPRRILIKFFVQFAETFSAGRRLRRLAT